MPKQFDVDAIARQVIDTTAVSTVMVDMDGVIMYVNKSFTKLLGYSSKQAVGHVLDEFVHSDDLADIASRRKESIKNPQLNYTTERQFVHKNGATVPVLSSVSVVHARKAAKRFITVQLTDLTAQKRAEKSLTLGEERLNYALQSARQGVWDSNLKTGHMYYSEMWREMRGLAPDEDIGLIGGWPERVHPDDRERVVEAVNWQDEGVFTEGGFEYREKHRDGHWIWILARGSAVSWDSDGKPIRIIGTDTEITQLKNSEQALVTMSHRLEIALSTSDLGVWEINLETNEMHCDDRIAEMYGVNCKSGSAISSNLLVKTVHPDDLEKADEAVRQAIKSKSALEQTFRIVRSDGTVRHIHSSCNYYLGTGDVPMFLGVDRDVTEDVRNAAILRQSKELSEQRNAELVAANDSVETMTRRLELALSISGIGVWDVDLNTGVNHWDERTKAIHGLSDFDGPEVPTKIWEDSLHPEDAANAIEISDKAIKAKTDLETKFRIITPTGEVRHIQTSCSYYVDSEGDPKFLGVDRDITEEVAAAADLKRAKELSERKNIELETAHTNMEHNSLHDALTSLPNRRYLDETLAGFSGKSGAALLHIDLDRFKQINDTLGHAAGDAMLVHAAEVLRSSVSNKDFVARIGGDEFVVFISTKVSDKQLKSIADRIIVKMREPVQYEAHECRFGVSVGIVSERGEGIDTKQMLVNADIALYRAKNKGRNRFEFFTKELQAEIISTKRRADEILVGLEQSQFVAYYQPQFDAHSLDVVGVEALARWHHPTEGVVFPDDFLKIAEDLNVVAKIDHLILEKALHHLEYWSSVGLDIPKISVNVSSRRLHDEELIETLKDLDIRPGTLSFELLESIFLDDSDEVITWNIDQIKDMGIGIDIDDFGTGHASIVGLVKLVPDRLKIDRQLVAPIAHSAQRRSLVKSIIEIGKSLGIQIVAEGVETIEHVHILQDLGCDTLQGYYFSQPMSAEDLVGFSKVEKWRQAS